MAFTGVASNLLSTAVVVANATGTQASALANANAQIQPGVQAVQITSGGAAYSALLPPSAVGLQVDVMTTTPGNTVAVFPSPGDAINALGVNAGITMAAVSSTTFTCMVQGQWWTNPKLPS